MSGTKPDPNPELQAWLKKLDESPDVNVLLEDLAKFEEKDRERIKVALEAKKIKRDGHWTRSPLTNVFVSFVAGIIIPLVVLLPTVDQKTRELDQKTIELQQKDREIDALKEQASKNRLKDIYAIFVENREEIYSTNVEKCKSFGKVTAAIFNGDPELASILDNLSSSVDNTECKAFLQNKSAAVDTNQPISPGEKKQAKDNAGRISQLSNDKMKKQIQNLIGQFTTPTRKIASFALSDLANKDTTKDKNTKSQIVDILIDSILPEKSDDAYRKNLYIAYTLANIDDWNSENYQKFCKLKKSDKYDDQTFKKRVDNAIKKLNKSKKCS